MKANCSNPLGFHSDFLTWSPEDCGMAFMSIFSPERPSAEMVSALDTVRYIWDKLVWH